MIEELIAVDINVENNGIFGDDRSCWEASNDLINEQRPHIVTFQEEGSIESAAMRAQRFGLAGWVSVAPDPTVRHYTALFLDTMIFNVHKKFELYRDWRIPATVVRASLWDNPDFQIQIVSWHLAHYSTRKRFDQIDELSQLIDKCRDKPGRPGMRFLGAGDCNSYPGWDEHEQTQPIDWGAFKTDDDRTHRWHRTALTESGQWVPDTNLTAMMTSTGMVDLARHAALNWGQSEALAPTAGHAPGTEGQGGPQRIDQAWADPRTANALTRFEVLKTSGDGKTQITDHHALVYGMDFEKLQGRGA